MFEPREKKIKPIIEYRPKKKAAVQLKPYVSVALLTVLVLGLTAMSLFFRAAICEEGHEIRQLEQKRVELSAENTRLTYEIQSKMAFVNLEQKASELGMRKMTRDQVVYIHLYDKDTAVLKDKTVVYGD